MLGPHLKHFVLVYCLFCLKYDGKILLFFLITAPTGLKAPKLRPLNTTAMEILWAAPAELNGPPPVYHIERTDVSFADAEGRVIRGRRFTGTGYFHFPSSTLPVNTDFTGMDLFQISESRHSDAVILRIA